MSLHETAQSVGWFVVNMVVLICVTLYLQIQKENKDALSKTQTRN